MSPLDQWLGQDSHVLSAKCLTGHGLPGLSWDLCSHRAHHQTERGTDREQCSVSSCGLHLNGEVQQLGTLSLSSLSLDRDGVLCGPAGSTGTSVVSQIMK